MKARVTITLDPDVHARAKKTARSRRTTVSGLIESFLRSPAAAPELCSPSLVDQMLGCAELRSPSAGTDPLFDALHDRHILSTHRAAAPASPRRRS